MSDCLFMNGMFADTLADISKAQLVRPGAHFYIQPYKMSRIVQFAESPPTPESPVTLYLSVQGSANIVSYRAKAVGWQDKRALMENPEALAKARE